MKTLTIKLTSPLQSYGNEATFNRRTTNEYPSKSAVIGLIAASLGLRRSDSRINNLNHLSFAVRIDQPGRIATDFQMVEYAKNSKKTARKLTYRDYLQDAVFIAAVGSDDDQLIDKIDYSLHHPIFQLYLGRRSNPPAGPLATDVYEKETPIEVLNSLSWQAEKWYQKSFDAPIFAAKIVADANLVNSNQTDLIKDQVGSFNQKHRFYRYRLTCQQTVKLKNPLYVPGTNHDIMRFL